MPHVRRLSEGGLDIIENTVVLCLICHRELYSGERKEDRSEWINLVVPWLIR
ncbi:HNH endonuclease [Enterovibrio norvegicus]|uniref:HNH endonuclease n=1 Tax=Enterovibrio norvegicus TaxID=188144 RepID=UPI00354B1BA8